MADLNIEEWIGDVYSERKTVQALPKRFSSTTKKLRVVQIYNSHTTQPVYIGKYTAVPASFNADATTLKAQYSLWLEFVDLYQLGYNYAGAYAILHILGTY